MNAPRNFWIKTDVDGRATPLAGGPRGKDGGFCTTITYRRHGSIADDDIQIRGRALSGGTLQIDVFWGDALLGTITSPR